MTRAARAIDKLCIAVARFATWLTVGMVLLGAFNAIARYLGRFVGVDLSSNTFIELQWYAFSAIFLLAAAGTLAKDGHVRVDVFYGRLDSKGKAWVDLLGTLLLLLPFCIFAFSISLPSVMNSWQILEGSPDPGGLPRYPIKTLVPLAFALLILQGIARAISSFVVIRSGARRAESS